MGIDYDMDTAEQERVEPWAEPVATIREVGEYLRDHVPGCRKEGVRVLNRIADLEQRLRQHETGDHDPLRVKIRSELDVPAGEELEAFVGLLDDYDRLRARQREDRDGCTCRANYTGSRPGWQVRGDCPVHGATPQQEGEREPERTTAESIGLMLADAYNEGRSVQDVVVTSNVLSRIRAVARSRHPRTVLPVGRETNDG